MIPISDNIYIRKQPIICYWLIAINIALFLWELKLGLSGELGNFVNNWGIIPGQLTTATVTAFSNPAAWIIVFWRLSSLITAMFLHSSFSQILGNLLFLWVFGKTVENFLGSKRFLVFYLLCGIFTGLLQIFAQPNLTVPLIGANGAIASVLGAYLFKFPKVRIDSILPLFIVFIPVQLPAFFYFFWWFIQQLFYFIGSLNIPGGVNSGTFAYWTHGMGIIMGMVIMYRLKKWR
jgi:membrane associated rhomboid family serine protease